MSHFNFEESISVGIERANVAEVNKNEIAEIFEDFSQSFQRASNNKIFSKIAKQTRTIRNNTSNPFLGATIAMMNNLSYESYMALFYLMDLNHMKLLRL